MLIDVCDVGQIDHPGRSPPGGSICTWRIGAESDQHHLNWSEPDVPGFGGRKLMLSYRNQYHFVSTFQNMWFLACISHARFKIEFGVGKVDGQCPALTKSSIPY